MHFHTESKSLVLFLLIQKYGMLAMAFTNARHFHAVFISFNRNYEALCIKPYLQILNPEIPLKPV